MTVVEVRRWGAASVLLGLCGVRLLALDMDAPYRIISPSGVFDADEGWYSKAAQLRSAFGSWVQPFDLTPFAHNPLFSLAVYGWSRLGGLSLESLRLLSALSSLVALMALWSMLRRAVDARFAGLCVAAIALSIHHIGFSRMALLEPTATAVAMGALWAWTRSARTEGPRALLFLGLALVLASVLPFIKMTFLATSIALWLLVGGKLLLGGRWGMVDAHPRRPRAWLLLASVLAVAAAHGWRLLYWPEQWRLFLPILREHLGPMSPLALLLNQMKAWGFNSVRRSGVGLLVICLGLCGGAFVVNLLRRRREEGRPLGPMVWLWVRSLPPEILALTLFACCTLGFIGMAAYQPPRYFYPLGFALAPLSLFALRAVVQVAAPRFTAAVLLGLLGAHGLLQIPDYVTWLARPQPFSNVRMAQAVARDVEAIVRDDEQAPAARTEVRLLGHRAAVASLYHGALPIRPIQFEFIDHEHYTLCQRLGYWRPEFLLESPQNLKLLQQECGGVRAQMLRQYPVMGSHTRLFRLHYDASGPHSL